MLNALVLVLLVAAESAPLPLPRPADAVEERATIRMPVPVPSRAIEAEMTGPETLGSDAPAAVAGVPDAEDSQAGMASTVTEAAAPGLVITRLADGTLTLAGTLDDPALEQDLLTRARALAGEATVSSTLSIAAGGPPLRAGLDGTIEAGFRALAELRSGVVRIEPGVLSLSGVAGDSEAIARAGDALAAQPWDIAVRLPLPLADPYRFVAEKGPSGIAISGHAPDEDTAARLTAVAMDVFGVGVSTDLELSRGMPDGDWPLLAEAGLQALAAAESGRLEITGMDVSLAATVGDRGGERRLRARLGSGWHAVVTLADPSPDPELMLTIRPGERPLAEGRLPRRLARAELSDRLGPVTFADGLGGDGYGDAATWENAIDAVSIAVPRIESGTIVLVDGEATFEGTLKDGFSAPELAAALRATLGADWESGIALAEAAPVSHLSLVRSADGVDVEGIVPDGTDAETVLAALGPVDLRNLSGGGDGDGARWTSRLETIGRALRAFKTGLVRIEGREIALSGSLTPGHEAADIAAWLSGALGPEWTVEVTAADPGPAAEGDTRIDFVTGHSQEWRGGFWITLHDFAVTEALCEAVLREAEAGEKLGFRPGSAELADGQDALLDRLAGVVAHCTANGHLGVVIEGHTDDRGDPAGNKALSEARALSVVRALTERGVAPDALTAEGWGDERPVADNETEAGRARNRRVAIGFRG